MTPHTIPQRIVKLLRVAQPKRDATGMLGERAIRGVFVRPSSIISMNGRMFISVGCKSGLTPGQYDIEGYTLKRSKYHNHFTPETFSNIPKEYTHVWDVPDYITAVKLSSFCLDIATPLDLGDCAKVVDVLYHDFRDCRSSIYLNPDCENDPIMIYTYGPEVIVSIYCLPCPHIEVNVLPLCVPYVTPEGNENI